MNYLTEEQVLFIHSRIIDETGGIHGLRNLGILQSAVQRPKATFSGRELYPNIFQKAASLMESLIRNHPFIDGNKRTAITSAGGLLRMNRYFLETKQKELARFTLGMASGKISLIDAARWFRRYAFCRT